MSNIYSFSGFACNGKTTLMRELNNYGIVFLEHAGMALEIGKDLVGGYESSNYLPFQCSLIATEIDRIKTWQRNIKYFSVDIYCDRNLIDILAFIYYHKHKTNKIKNNTPENLIEILGKYLKNIIRSYPIYNKIFLIKPNEKPEYALSNCLRKDREETIDINSFIDHEIWWFNKYKEIYDELSSYFNYAKDLIILEHPSKIGFDQFYKIIFDQINLIK